MCGKCDPMTGNFSETVKQNYTQFYLNLIISHSYNIDERSNATNHKQFCKKARMDPIFKKLNFGSLSIQTTPKHMCDFQF